MEEQLVSFETAEMLRDIGFDLPCSHQYREGDAIPNHDTKPFGVYISADDLLLNRNDGVVDSVFSAPTQSLAQKWFREKHEIFVSVYIYNYESPGSFYFLPRVDFQRGHSKLYTSYSKKLCNKYKEKCWKGEIKSTLMPNAHEDSLEMGLREAAKIVKDEKVNKK